MSLNYIQTHFMAGFLQPVIQDHGTCAVDCSVLRAMENEHRRDLCFFVNIGFTAQLLRQLHIVFQKVPAAHDPAFRTVRQAVVHRLGIGVRRHQEAEPQSLTMPHTSPLTSAYSASRY